MIWWLAFTLLFETVFAQKEINEKSKHPKSFTFYTSRNREFTLKQGSPRSRQNFVQRLSKKILGRDDDDEGWYYIHVFQDKFSEAKQIVSLNSMSTLLRNTYVVYLTSAQVERLENVSLLKKLESEDKFAEDGGPIESTNYFHVITNGKTELESKDELYKIERVENENTYIVFVDETGLKPKALMNKKKETIKYLSSLRFVKTVSTFTRPTIKNNIMTGYTQRNAPPTQISVNNSNQLRYLPRYVNDKGITGKGQIVTIQDTPIDFYHAMFRDDSVPMKLNTAINNHRKFVYYGSKSTSINDWSSKLEVNEHGTHVAGTTAGKSICSNDLYIGTSLFDGNAPDAKILYAGGLNDVSAQQLGSLMKSHNSYISTNSWGVNGYNDQINYEYGKLAQDNPERLFLFAAGNEYSEGNFTVCDPGGSKNVLTVGAMGDFFEKKHYYRIQSGTKYTDAISLLPADPWTVGSIGTTSSSDIVVINPSNGNQCNTINSGKISLLYATSPQDTSLSWIFDCQLESTSGILLSTSPQIVLDILNSGQASCTDITKIDPQATITHADYSSAGPANKGILKPDIMTPGTAIISAKSRAGANYIHGCQTTQGGDFTYMQGTSMATPNAAGAATLVRQFFSDSKWNSEKIDLDATTLRALMINSCKHPRSAKTPDVLFGHGIVDLSTILPFDDTFGVQITRQRPISGANLLAGAKPSVGEQQHVEATITVTSSNKPLQITLSYLDPMLDQSSAIPLTRDLDLIVRTPNGTLIKGDHLETGDTQHFSTNEKIIINRPVPGEYKVFVVGGDFVDSSLSSDRQEFAVVASGPIENKYIEFKDPTTCMCDSCNPANPTECFCRDGYIGNVCQVQVQVVDGSEASVKVPALEMERVFFQWDKEIKSVKVKSSNGGRGSTVWAAPTCQLTLGQYQANGGTSGFFNKGVKTNFGNDYICVAIFNNNYQASTYSIEVSDKESSGLGKTNTIVIVVVAIAVLAAVGVVVYCCCCKNRGGGGVGDDGGSSVSQSLAT